MGIVISMNRRTAFILTFFAVFLGWASLHSLITGNNNYDWLEFILLLCASFGSAYYAARRFPPMGRRL